MVGTLDVVRRPETAEDAAFRFVLFRDSRHFCESLPGIDPALADQLMRQQFAGQAASYQANFPAARRDIIEVDGTPVGHLVVDQARGTWTLVDIALLGAWRGRGIGTRLLTETMAAARAACAPLRLHVKAYNTDAARLYAKLGFVAAAPEGIETEMVWTPPIAAKDSGRRSPYPDRLCLPLAVDAAAMAEDLARLDETQWIAHFVPQNYDGDWSVIPLRAKAGATHPVMMIFSDPSCVDFEDTPFLAACPAIRATLARFHCPLLAVRLMRLGPGSIIKRHVDHDLDAGHGTVRLHVPILTNADVDFRLAGHRVTMLPGETWYLELSEPHSVANHGATSRVHLVIDALVNDWLTAVFDAAGKDDAATAGTPR